MMFERETGHVSSSITNQEPLVSPVAPAPTARVDIQTGILLTNARVLRAHGENEMALQLLRQASNRDSKNPAVLRPLAEALMATGREREVLIVRKNLAKFEATFENIFEYAQALYRSGDDQQSLQSYYEAMAVLTDAHPHLFEIHKNMGNIFVRAGDFEAAEESYNNAFRIDNASDLLMVNFATLAIQRGDKGRALECFRRAVELNAINDRAWTGLAMIHNEFGDHELAWGNLEHALELNPANRTAVHLAAHWATRDQTPIRGIQRLENFLSSGEADEEMSLVLVNLFCNAGNLDLAAIETERILAWNPDRQDVTKLRRHFQGVA